MERGLNTLELRHALSSNSFTKKHFDGIYPIDFLKDVSANMNLIVINTAPHYKSGEHWILLYRTDSTENVVEFFDSLGKSITDYSHELEEFVTKHFQRCVRVVEKRIQPVNTYICGHYCLHYALFRCSRVNPTDIINNMPSTDWIRKCIPFLFDIVPYCIDYQCCKKK